MERVAEPELMDGAAQAEAYARANFEEPNQAFCEHLSRLFSPLPVSARVLDLGTGPADIPVRLARRHRDWRFDAVDGSAAMLGHASRAVAAAGLQERIRLTEAILPSAALGTNYNLVLSNSLLHHLHDPSVLWQTIRAVGRRGTLVLVMDLRRPPSQQAAEQLVGQHTANEPDVLRTDFYNSLLAAYTPGEVERQLVEAHLLSFQVHVTSNRHLIVAGVLES